MTSRAGRDRWIAARRQESYDNLMLLLERLPGGASEFTARCPAAHSLYWAIDDTKPAATVSMSQLIGWSQRGWIQKVDPSSTGRVRVYSISSEFESDA